MGAFVPIRQYLGDNRWFSPEDLGAMGKAFTSSDPLVEMVARRIVRAADVRRARSDQAVRDRSRRRRRCQRRLAPFLRFTVFYRPSSNMAL